MCPRRHQQLVQAGRPTEQLTCDRHAISDATAFLLVLLATAAILAGLAGLAGLAVIAVIAVIGVLIAIAWVVGR